MRGGEPRRLNLSLGSGISGSPIAHNPKSGGLYDFSAMRRARWSEFYSDQHTGRNLGYDYNFQNKYVAKAPGGRTGFIGNKYQSARRESSSAQIVKDPLDAFKPHRAMTKLKGAGVQPRIRFIDTKRMRNRAQFLYNKANPQNINELDLQRKYDYQELKHLKGNS